MLFSDFLKILNCYIECDKSQYDFMHELFSLIVCEPFTNKEITDSENDNYYPFSNLCGNSIAKKVYIGERCMPKPLARFTKSHYDPTQLIDILENVDDIVRKNLCNDLKKHGIECNIDNVANVVSDTFYKFIEAAINEQDNIETNICAKVTSTIEKDCTTNKDVFLLNEVENQCPLCGKTLLRSKNDNAIKKYKVIKIFPDNLALEKYLSFSKLHNKKINYDSQENLIPLCIDCSLEYLENSPLDTYRKLLKIKNSLMKKNDLRQNINDIELENEIHEIIYKLVNISNETKLVKLDMNALKIEQKIHKSNQLLINSISENVFKYYNYIEEIFAEIDEKNTGAFNRIASEVRLIYTKFEGEIISQEEIFSEIVSWMRRKIGIEICSDIAIRILVSFFVQNCEVFNEISE